MAAWGVKPTAGAWAAQVDEEEEENGGELAPVPAAAPKKFPALSGSAEAFPSLGETATMKDTKKERKKRQGQKMSLGAFVAAGRKEPEITNLPTAPRARSDDVDERRDGLGGGFKNYGGDRGSYEDRHRDRDDDRGFRRMEDEGPSRADAADDWGTKKAFVPSGPSRGGFGDRDRGGGFSDRYTERRSGFGDGDHNRADDADRWESKGFEPSSRRGGFEDGDRQSSFGSRDFGAPSRADTEDRWSRRGLPEESSDRFGVGSSTSSGTRPRLVLKPRSADLPIAARSASSTPPPEGGSEDSAKETTAAARSGARPNPFGAAKPVDVKEPPELARSESKASQSADPNPPLVVPTKQRSNPFGAARPREEVLRGKGIDLAGVPSGRQSPHASSASRSPPPREALQEVGCEEPGVEIKPESAAAIEKELPKKQKLLELTLKLLSGPLQFELLLRRRSAPALEGSGGAAGAELHTESDAVEQVREMLDNGSVSAQQAAKPTVGTWAKIASKPAPEISSEAQ